MHAKRYASADLAVRSLPVGVGRFGLSLNNFWVDLSAVRNKEAAIRFSSVRELTMDEADERADYPDR